MLPRLLILLLLALPTLAHADNPFGLMLRPAPGQDLALTAARAAALGVAWYRPPTLFIDRWRADTPCEPCRALRRSGLAVALTIRNGGRDSLPRLPSTPPADLAAYGKSVAAILDQWQPAMLVIEDEENRPLRYADSRVAGQWDNGGDPAAGYLREVTTACALAHARQILCSNGGLSFEASIGLTWLTLLREGKPELACDYAKRINQPDLCRFGKADALPEETRKALLQNADLLLPVYRQAPIDAVNIHWYGADAIALALTIDVLGRLTGKPVMSNEIGQRRTNPSPLLVRPLLRAAMAGRLRLAIWYSVDGNDSLSLFEEDGRLRPAGEEFAHQMSGRK